MIAPSVTLEYAFIYIFVEEYHRQGHVDALWHTRGTPGIVFFFLSFQFSLGLAWIQERYSGWHNPHGLLHYSDLIMFFVIRLIPKQCSS